MKNSLKPVLIFFALIFAAAAGVLYFLSSQQNPNEYEGIHSTIQDLRSLDQEWISETVKVKSDPQANFDSLASFIPRVKPLQSRLLSIANNSGSIPEELSNQLKSYSSEIDSKVERLERFKTAYAVLRNSVRFLPLAAQQASLSARERNETQVANKFTELETSIAQYVGTPVEAKLNALKVEVKQFEDQLSNSANGLQDEEIEFLSHAKVILDKKPVTEKFYSEAISSNTTTIANSLVQASQGQRSVRLEKRNNFLKGMMGALGLLVLTALASLFVKSNSPKLNTATAETMLAPGHDINESDFDTIQQPTAETDLFNSEDRGSNESNALVKALADISSNEMQSASQTIDSNIAHILDVRNELTQRLEETKSRVLNKTGEWTPSEVNFLISDLVSQSRLDSLPQFLKEIKEQTTNITITAETMSEFTRTDIKTDYKEIDIRECIDHMIDNTGVESIANVTKNYDDVPGIFASESEILIIFRSIFQKVIQNIGLANHANGILKINVSEADGNISVTILDNGKGMDPETRQKVLSFFLKENGAMSGIDIGTKLIRLFSTKYKGRVAINSDEHKGTIMRLSFPVANIGVASDDQAIDENSAIDETMKDGLTKFEHQNQPIDRANETEAA